jgi:cysteine desulfurase
MIYLDNNATTQAAPEVIEAMLPFLSGAYGNPSSAHSPGQESLAAVENARRFVAELLAAGSPHEIVFTSGGTESDSWAILGALRARPGRNHIVTTRVEHEAIRKLCEKLEGEGCQVTWLDVDESGLLDPETVRGALSDSTAVVSVMLANNETGVLFPIYEIAEIVKEHSDALFHVDGVNAAGKVPIDLKDSKIDLFSISAHKFHGPKGIGALYIRDGIEFPSLQVGGGQERGRRAGTEAVHQITGLGAAAILAGDLRQMEVVRAMRDRLESGLLDSIPNSFRNGTGDPSRRLPNTANISFEDTNGEMILARLDDLGICVSTGSACNAGRGEASATLQAMNVPYSRTMGSIRFSLGRFNTEAEIERVLEVLPGIIDDLRRLAG